MVTSIEIAFEEIGALSVKEEQDDDQLNTDILEPNTKCGEVYYECNNQFTLVCTLCTDSFHDLEGFGNHMQNLHLPKEPDTVHIPFEYCPVIEHRPGALPVSECREEAPQETLRNSSVTELKAEEDNDSVEEANSESVLNGDLESENDVGILLDSLPVKEVFSCSLCGAKYKHKRSFYTHARKHHGILTKQMKDKLEREDKRKARREKNILKEKVKKSLSTQNATTNDEGDFVEETLEVHVVDSSEITSAKFEGSAKASVTCENVEMKAELSVTSEGLPHAEVFSCSICGHKYKHKKSYYAHARTHHGLFTNRMKRKIGNLALQDDRQGSNESDKDKDNMKNTKPPDTNEENEEFEYPCTLCNRGYHYRKSLRAHIKNIHGDEALCTMPQANRNRYGHIALFDEKTIATLSAASICKEEIVNEQEEGNIPLEVKGGFEATNDSFDKKTNVSDRSDGESETGDATFLEQATTVKKIFSCSICGSKYKHRRSYNAHAKKYHGLLTEKAKEIRAWRTVLNAQIAENKKADEANGQSNDVEYPCALCTRVYRSKRSLHIHLKINHGIETGNSLPKNRCKYCDVVFEDNDTLEAHIESIHPGTEKYACSYCDKKFKSKFGCKVHEYTHTGERPHKCPFCPKEFTMASNMRTHINAHLDIKKYACKHCDKLFVRDSERKIHERRHTGEKPFQCEECGGRFITQAQLSYHLNRHQNKRDYKCVICDKGFFDPAALNYHKTVHAVDRPFKCKICSRTFARRKTLRQHEQVHSKKKKYVCVTCGKAFAQHAGLCSHKKLHEDITKE